MSDVRPPDPDDTPATPDGTSEPDDASPSPAVGASPAPPTGPYEMPPPTIATGPAAPAAPYAAYPPPVPPGPYPGYAPAPTAPLNGKAVASLSLGVTAVVMLVLLFCLWFAAPVVGLLAVVFGHLALRELRTDGRRGRGLAIAGLVTGYVVIALALVGFALLALLVSTSSTTTPG